MESLLEVPEACQPGHRRARAMDPELADRFVEHPWIGDTFVDLSLRYDF